MTSGYMAAQSVWEGKLVRLRAVEPGDWQHFFDWDADTEFARHDYDIWFPGSREASHKWTEELAMSAAKNHEYRRVIETLAGEFAGTLNTHTCDARVGCFRYGVAIRREHWRKGYATEATAPSTPMAGTATSFCWG